MALIKPASLWNILCYPPWGYKARLGLLSKWSLLSIKLEIYRLSTLHIECIKALTSMNKISDLINSIKTF